MINAELIKSAIDDFEEIQEYMLLAEKENATETYAKLEHKYLKLKTFLNVLGVNLTSIDKINA